MQSLDPNIGLLVASIASLGLAAAVFAASWARVRPRRVEPGPVTSELRPETPALVDLLTGEFTVGDDAVAATLVDLASRGHLDIDGVGGADRRRSRPRRGGRLTTGPLGPNATHPLGSANLRV